MMSTMLLVREFSPQNQLVLNFHNFSDGRVFVSFYGRNGSYIPLATVSKYEDQSGYLVEPYPSWEFYNFKLDKPYYSYNPKIYSIYRTTVNKNFKHSFFGHIMSIITD